MSITKKIRSISKGGIEPIIEGYRNKKEQNIEIEKLAVKRSKICMGCDDMLDEPIGFFKVSDSKITGVSNKMCDRCGCAVPLKIRQSKEICKEWNKLPTPTAKLMSVFP